MEHEARIRNMMLEAFIRTEALLKGHVVFTSGRHGNEYINKDAIYPHVREVSHLCFLLAEKMRDTEATVVVAPEKGGIILSHGVARELGELTGRDILSVYAEREEDIISRADANERYDIYYKNSRGLTGLFKSIMVPADGKLILRKNAFGIGRGYDVFVAGKKVLVVEDIINTGGSVRKTIKAVQHCGGNVVGVGALCNRGGVTAKGLCGVPVFAALANIPLRSWTEEECILCARGIPVRTDVGKGKEFLARMWR